MVYGSLLEKLWLLNINNKSMSLSKISLPKNVFLAAPYIAPPLITEVGGL